jgi:hypothetical protein
MPGRGEETRGGKGDGAAGFLLNLLGDFALPLIFLALILADPFYFRELLTTSMPLRGLYQPLQEAQGVGKAFNWDGLAFLYFLPFLYGLFAAYRRAGITGKSRRPAWEMTKIGFLYSFLALLPLSLLLTWSEIRTRPDFLNVVGCAFLLIPGVIFLGIFCYSAVGLRHTALPLPAGKRSTAYRLIPVLIFVGYVILRLYMLGLSRYPIGNDVYYHTALSLRIAEGCSPFSSPIMPGVANFYPFLPHLLVAGISRMTGISSLRIWPYFDLFVQVLMLGSFYLFALEISGDIDVALLSLLLFLPWDQFWLEHSSRHLALAVLPVFWIFLVRYGRGNGRKYLLYALLAFFIMCACHHLVPLLALVTGVLYLALVAWGSRCRRALAGLRRKVAGYRPVLLKPATSQACSAFLRADLSFAAAFYLLSVVTVSLLLFGFLKFSAPGMIRFGEAVIGINRPMGVVTLVTFPMGLAGLAAARREDEAGRKMLVSISLLFLTAFFYLTKIGIKYPNAGFHHFRISGEITMASFTICAAVLLVSARDRRRSPWRDCVVIITVIALLLSLAGIYGKFRVQEWYAGEINERMERYGQLLEAVSALPLQSIVLCNPDDYVNRYIPGVTGRRIFVARYSKTDDGLAIISPTLGFFAGDSELRLRYEAARRYYRDLTDLALLAELKDFAPITHVVVSSRDPANSFFEESGVFRKIFAGESYCLYELVDPW